MLLKGRMLGGRADVRAEWLWNGPEHGSPQGFKPRAGRQAGRKEKSGKHQRWSSKICHEHSELTCKPDMNRAKMQLHTQLQLPSDTMTNACTTSKIKSRLHPAIKARQTQFPTSHRTALPCERLGSVSSHKHHPLFPLLSPIPSERPLSTGAYLHRDGKGTEERKSILYLTTKHNPNQKQLEFAGCSINWTASSGRMPCRWIATVMHYSTMARAWVC